jgi:very-short-patch-repair endonuclease
MQVTSMGNKRSLGPPDFMARSLQQAGALNPNLREDRWRGWLVKGMEEGGESERVMGKSYKGQLHWGLSCGQHFKLCAAASIARAADLLCHFCTPDNVLCMSGKKIMSLAEHRLAVQLQSAGSLAEFRFQARVVPGWQGAIDFYCPETSLCIEVDDEHHFLSSIHGQYRAKILKKDVRLNAACLAAGLSMLRLSHHELVSIGLNVMGLLQQVQSIIKMHPCCRLLVLSPFYANVKMGSYGTLQVPTYLEECYKGLRASANCQYMGAPGMQGTCHFFML